MPDLVLPSKLTRERYTVVFDFKDELDWQETIQEATVTITVASGVDNSPQLLLYKQAIPLVTEVSQQLHEGVPGVIYKVECVALGSTGQIYTRVTGLAILPSDAIRPPIVATFLTSEPYPIQTIEGLASTGIMQFGTMLTRPVDGISSLGFIVAGSLEQILRTYTMQPEGIESVGSIISGDLFSSLKTYTMKPEGINSTAFVVTGSLELGLIIYSNYKPEGIESTGSIISGTLT